MNVFRNLKAKPVRSRKKAQAAMEFLMTYGWAILAVLVALGALWWGGFISPYDIADASSCRVGAGFSCVDYGVVTLDTPSVHDEAVFTLINNQGFDLDHFEIIFDGDSPADDIENCNIWESGGTANHHGADYNGASNNCRIGIGENCSWLYNEGMQAFLPDVGNRDVWSGPIRNGNVIQRFRLTSTVTGNTCNIQSWGKEFETDFIIRYRYYGEDVIRQTDGSMRLKTN